MPAQLVERDDPLQFAHQLDVHHEPARALRVAVGIVVIVLGVEGSLVRIAFLDDAYDAGDARNVAARIVEEGGVALLHRVPERVSRLIVPYAVPGGRLLRLGRKVLDAEGVRLRFEQPVIHDSLREKNWIPDSVAKASSRTS